MKFSYFDFGLHKYGLVVLHFDLIHLSRQLFFFGPGFYGPEAMGEDLKKNIYYSMNMHTYVVHSEEAILSKISIF